ncbi:unnamed protein product [Durusdinium trenchii]|uniref:Uncharacterized protein n=1 Tax=Durusdinium trenchii TaxID=1381693 RepID=A0ABP0PKW4_9DINO
MWVVPWFFLNKYIFCCSFLFSSPSLQSSEKGCQTCLGEKVARLRTRCEEIATKFVSVCLNLSSLSGDVPNEDLEETEKTLPKKQGKRKKKQLARLQANEAASDEDDDALLTMLETEAATGEVLFHDDFASQLQAEGDLLNADAEVKAPKKAEGKAPPAVPEAAPEVEAAPDAAPEAAEAAPEAVPEAVPEAAAPPEVAPEAPPDVAVETAPEAGHDEW